MMMGADQGDEPLRRPKPTAREAREQERQETPRMAQGAKEEREASRHGLGSEAQRVRQRIGQGLGRRPDAHSSSSPNVVSDRAGW